MKKVPGLRSLRGSVNPLMGARDIPYSRVIEASFDSLADVMADVQSSAGQAEKEQTQRFGAVAMMWEARDL